VKGNFMKKVAAQELQLAADAKVRILNDATEPGATVSLRWRS